MKKIFTVLLFASFLCGGLLFSNNVSNADGISTKFEAGLKGTGQLAGYDGATTEKPEEHTLMVKIGNAVKIILSLVGVIFLILMIYGGYTWMIAQGSTSDVDKAKDTIEAAIIGLIIVLAAYAITAFISQGLVVATTTTIITIP